MSNRQSTWAVACLTAGTFLVLISLATCAAYSQPRTVHTDTTIRSIP
jgi:hypothetical protein